MAIVDGKHWACRGCGAKGTVLGDMELAVLQAPAHYSHFKHDSEVEAWKAEVRAQKARLAEEKP